MKKVNKTAALKMTAARTTALAGVRQSAFNAGVSRSAVIAAVAAACGAKPVLALYNAAKVELQIGFMAAALARKAIKGLPTGGEAIMAHCRDRLANYGGFGGTAKLRAGQAGRRTKAEEDAYGSARVSCSSIFRDAGVTLPESRGGDTSKTRAARPGTKASAKVAANDGKPVVRSFKDKAALIGYARIQGAAMLATLNKNARIAPNELKSAVQDFNSAVAKLA